MFFNQIKTYSYIEQLSLKNDIVCVSLVNVVGTLPQLIGFIRFGEPVPHGLSARHRVWAGPTKG